MGSLKRRIAEARVKLRKRQRDKEEKEIHRLQEQRNKALKSAKRSLVIAKAREDAKDAALKRSKAKARLNDASNRRGKAMLSSMSRGSKVLLKSLRAAGEGLIEQKPARRKRKATKKRR